jgi:hypothetical protein
MMTVREEWVVAGELVGREMFVDDDIGVSAIVLAAQEDGATDITGCLHVGQFESTRPTNSYCGLQVGDQGMAGSVMRVH